MRRPVEDSTRGNSKLNPKTYKGDVPVQTWLDSRYLATMSNWLDKQGISNRFLSDVVRNAVEIVVDSLVSQCEIEMVDDTTIARDTLEFKYRIILNSNGRGTRNIKHNLILTERKKEFNQVFVNNSSNPNADLIAENTRKALEILNNNENIDRTKNFEVQKRAAYNSPRCVKVKGEFNDPEELMQRARANDEALKNF